MEIVVSLEFRKYEEKSYDFTDGSGKRVSGVGKFYTFLTADDEIIMVKRVSDNEPSVTMVKGQIYDVCLNVNLKPCVFNGTASEKKFVTDFDFIDVVPFENDKQKQKEEPASEAKPEEKQDKKSKIDKLGGVF